ncbi:MAG: hypothetical protein Q9227_003185 [Pyrenula ochraceoflavens]
MSSPFTQTPKQLDQPEKSKEASESQSDVWEEPPPRPPAASYEDVPGLERHGVLEHMAPLGTVPNQKILQRLKIFSNRPSHRFSSPTPAALVSNSNDEEGNTVPTNGYASVETHSPANLSPRSDSVKPEEMITRASSARARAAAESASEDHSDPAAPPASAPQVADSATPQARHKESPPEPNPATLDATSSTPKTTLAPNHTSASHHSPASATGLQFPGATSPTNEISTTYSRDIMKYNTRIAMELAEQSNQPYLALALNQFWADSATQPPVLRALDRFFARTADRRDRKLLKTYIKAAQAEIAHRSRRQSSKSATSPVAPPSASQTSPSTQRHEQPVNHAPPTQAAQGQPQLHRLDTSVLGQDSRRAPPSRKGSSKSSESSTVVVASAEPVTAVQEPTPIDMGLPSGHSESVRRGELSVPRSGRGRQSRSRSASTSSSLSSAQSLDAEIYAPAIEVGAQASEGGAAPGSSRGPAPSDRRQATIRGALPPLPSSELNHHHQSRRQDSPAYLSFPTVNQKAERRRRGKEQYPFLTEEERVHIEAVEGQLARSTYEHSSDPQVAALRQNINAQQSQTRPPLDESRESADDPRAGSYLEPDRFPVVHPNSCAASKTVDEPSSPLEPPSSPMIAVSSPAIPHFPNLRNGISKKRPRNDFEEDDAATPASSGAGDHLAPPTGGVLSSRAGTPKIGGRPAKKIKKSARVMISYNADDLTRPQKNKTAGITAGMSRTTRSMKDNDAANAVDSDEELSVDHSVQENNDFCGACGGNGELLCCDGCPNSFHFSCADPPINPKQPPEGEWFCSACQARNSRRNRPEEANRLFKDLFPPLANANPKSFALPSWLRSYHEGVTTGEQGEYVEVVTNRANHEPFRMNRMGAFEEPDYRKPRDKDNKKLLLCAACNRGTDDGKRELIPCDFCPARFHLDCLDPPLAVTPRRKPDNKPSSTWRCPLHTDELVKNIDQVRTAEHIKAIADPESLGVRRPKLRRPKDAVVKDVALSRGFPNNGLIEVELMPERSTRFEEIDMGGTIWRLPEKGIRQDFIDKVNRSNADQLFKRADLARKRAEADRSLPTSMQTSALEAQIAQVKRQDREANQRAKVRAETEGSNRRLRELSARTFAEQRAALNLLQLASGVAQNEPSTTTPTSANAVNAGTESHGKKRNASEITGGDNEQAEQERPRAVKAPKMSTSSKIEPLIRAMITEAPDQIVSEMADDERRALQTVIEMAQARLKMLGSGSPETNGNISPQSIAKEMANGVAATSESMDASMENTTQDGDNLAMEENNEQGKNEMGSPGEGSINAKEDGNGIEGDASPQNGASTSSEHV